MTEQQLTNLLLALCRQQLEIILQTLSPSEVTLRQLAVSLGQSNQKLEEALASASGTTSSAGV